MLEKLGIQTRKGALEARIRSLSLRSRDEWDVPSRHARLGRAEVFGMPPSRTWRLLGRYGNGYLMVAEDGGVFDFSDKPFSGSTGDNPPANPMVSITTLD